MLAQKKITFDRFIRGILGVAVIVGILYLLNRLSGVLLPFFIAWLAAYLSYPMVIFYQNKLHMKSRVLSILAVMLTLLILATVIFLLFIPPMVEECVKLKNLLEVYLTQNISEPSIPEAIDKFIRNNINLDWLHQLFSAENIFEAIRRMLPKFWQLLTTGYNILITIFTLFIAVLYYFFILLDYEQIANGWITLIEAKHRPLVIRITTDVKDSMNHYFRGQALVALCVGILFSIGFLIIDFPMAIGLGLFIGMLNMVPYLQIIGYIPTIILALLKAADTNENFWWILGLATIVFCVVQLIQDTFLVPKIMGKITGLNPAIILLSLSIWGSLMGMLGMIIALPLTTLLLSYYQRYIQKKDLQFLSQQTYLDNQDNTEDTVK
ncbi:AI-2E family transporter [uncultured Bacteroides sp.]|uniref:AI-2E family transporter n=1 Tax=uncultured Bacteroides sp. TaxID=162156 RepID=UPI00261AB8C3|nr:AI-2E family transporter [uncultured Bacteroides sp.]